MTTRALRTALTASVLLMGAAGVVIAESPLPEIGQAVPDFTLPVLDGDVVTLSEGRSEGSVVLVFFRGVW